MAGELAALDIAFTASGADQTAAAINKVSTAATNAAGALSSIENVNPMKSFSTAQLGKMAASMDKVANISQRAAAGLDKAGVAADRASGSITRLAANQNKLGFQTANIGAQFQDIAVQLQAGQSPFTIALQQGTQLSAVLNTVGGGAKGVGAALGAAFSSILSPVSLLTIGIIAAGGALFQYFTSADDEAETANAAIKKHNDMIRSVATEWGDVVPAIKAYADEVDRVQKSSDLKIVGGQKIAEDLEAINKQLDEFISNNQDIADAVDRAFDGTGKAKEALSLFAGAYETLLPKIRNGTATQEDFTKASLLLSAAVKENPDELAQFAKGFDTVSERALNAIKALAEFQRQMEAALKTGIAVQADIQNRTTGQINNPNLPDNRFQLPINGPSPEARPPIELEGLPDIKKTAGDAQKAVSAYAKELKNLQLTQQQSAQSLQLESDMLGHSVEEYNRATAALKAKQDLQKTGIDLSSQQAQAYVKEAEALADARTNIDRQKAAYQSLQQEQGALIDGLVQGATTFGSSWKDTLKNVSQQFTDWVAQMGIANPLKNMLTGTNLPTLGDLFSGKTQVPGAQSTASMTVTAAVVNVNGSPVGGLPGFPTSGVPGTNTTLGQFLGVGANNNAGTTTPTSMLAYQNAIKSIESNGGDYGIMGPVTKSGDRAYGAYQVMGNNIPSWTQKYTGTQMTPQQFLADPSAQDKVFNGEFGSYVDKYGPSGAASKWFTGSATPTGKQDMLGTSDNQYVQKFNDSLAKATPNVADLGATSTKTATDITSSLGQLAAPSATPGATGGTGLFSWLGSLFGFASGGYTGNGHSRQPAGIVHKGEYVFDAAATRRIGAGNLARIRAGSGREYIPANTNARGSLSKSDVNVKVGVDKSGNLQAYVESIANEKAGAVGQQTRAYMDAYDRDRLPLRMQEINDRPYDRG